MNRKKQKRRTAAFVTVLTLAVISGITSFFGYIAAGKYLIADSGELNGELCSAAYFDALIADLSRPVVYVWFFAALLCALFLLISVILFFAHLLPMMIKKRKQKHTKADEVLWSEGSISEDMFTQRLQKADDEAITVALPKWKDPKRENYLQQVFEVEFEITYIHTDEILY